MLRPSEICIDAYCSSVYLYFGTKTFSSDPVVAEAPFKLLCTVGILRLLAICVKVTEARWHLCERRSRQCETGVCRSDAVQSDS